jgi:hypothetical protein
MVVSFERRRDMSGNVNSNYAGRSQEDRIAQEKRQKQPAQGQSGGDMARPGTEADKDHSCGELTERGKQVWRAGSGIDGGGKT